MAVEARHHSIFPQQLLGNRVIMKAIEANSNISNTQNQIGYGLPLSGTTTAETFVPVISDSFPPQKPVIKSDSNLSLPSRKRSRESFNPLLSYSSIQTTNYNKSCTPFSFFGRDMSLQIQEQQLEVDRLITQHMEKVRIEIEERRKRQARRLMDAIEESVMMKLKAKEEEIEKIGKLNWALEERIKSLCMENQIWRELAQTNEATANALRTNLEQVLAAARGLEEEIVDDAESCWEDNTNNCGGDIDATDQIGSSRLCRNCCKEESCVLLLPCRHLCLCSVCGSCLHTCPVCKSPKTVTVHVNMS